MRRDTGINIAQENHWTKFLLTLAFQNPFRKGDLMKKIILISSIFLFCLLISVSHTHAQSSIAGWWKTGISIQQGDFQTGTWDSINARGKHACYLYIFLSTSTSGSAYLALWDAPSQSYILETYNLYIQNNIAVLVIPTSEDTDGNILSGATIVLRLSGGPNTLNSMNGYYTLFDIDPSTPEQLVRMGPVAAYRVNPKNVPTDAVNLVSGQPLP